MKSALVVLGLLFLLGSATSWASVDPTGSWRSACHLKRGYYGFGVLTFEHGTLNETWDYYSDADCKNQTMTVLISLKYSLGKHSSKDPDMREIDDEFVSTAMVLRSEQVVKYFNQTTFCGFKDWVKDTPKDVTGASSCQIPAQGTKFYSIVSSKDGKIYLGKADEILNGSSPEKRPVEIDLSVAFEKLKYPKVDRDLLNYDTTVEQMTCEFKEIPANSQDKEWVKRKLKHMVAVDQYMRNQMLTLSVEHQYTKEEQDYFWRRFGPRFMNVDRENTADVKELLKIYSWFKISEFGEQADRDAWLLVQHADLDVPFQKQVLEILTRLYPVGETSKSNYAYLWDRVAVAEKRPQRYGTQGQCVGPAKWEPFTIENAEQVDKRRAEVGLQSMAEYKKQFVNICR